jgi:hypothetical protein
VTQEDYDDYVQGHEAGEEVAEEDEEGKSFGEEAEEQLGRLLIHDPYAHKSEMWWKGFQDGKDGTWDPPEVDEEADKETEEESE